MAFAPDIRWFPACPVYQLLGLRCPGCGASRALAALVHGQPRIAMQQNLLFVVSLPFLAGYGVISMGRAFRKAEFTWPHAHPLVLYTGVAAALVFTLFRNV